jgi:OPT oligopeptide transporter protein
VSTVRLDKELEEFRNMMEVPSTFEDGFSATSLVGALFIALLMVPGAMYMQLLAGMGVGPAAQWVTVILFIEVARRAHKRLRRAEIFVLFYMAGAVMAQPFSGLLYNQFFAQSQAAVGMGIADKLPQWFAPSDPDILAQRSFLNPAWYPAVGLIIFQTLMGRLNSAILSYGLFRVASDIEKLPFPMAPIGAQGILALAEQQSEESGETSEEEAKVNWRWRVFSIGGVLGLAFGALYLALPTISSALLDKPISILPIPFADWTPKTSGFLPAVATGLNLNLGQLVIGMVLPFFAVLGSFIGFLITVVANPVLYYFDFLTWWDPSDDTVRTLFKNNIDFYFAFTIGVMIAIAIGGMWQVGVSIRRKTREDRKRAAEAALEPSKILSLNEEAERMKQRGDIPTSMIVSTYVLTSVSYVLLSGYLIDWHPNVMIVLCFFAFLYTPIINYVTARLEGMAGQVVQIPMVREAAFIISGYREGVDIWFLPLPLAQYGRRVVFYRQAELTGTKFWSIWKAELFVVPIVLVSSIFFAEFIWSLAPIPGPEYPFAERMWELDAANRSIIYSSTLGGYSTFEEAFKTEYLLAGTGFGVVLFFCLSAFHLPVMLVYGVVRGLNQTLPHVVLPQFIGALIGRYYFQKRLGLKWRQYIPVVAAGFSCGMGLVTILGVGVTFLAKSVIKIPF